MSVSIAPMMDKNLSTARLILRQIEERDVPDIAKMNADPDVMLFIGDGATKTDEENWRFCAVLLGHWALRGYGMYVMEEKSTGAFAGLVGLHYPPSYPSAELGWRLPRHQWGKGYAEEAASVVRDHAFERGMSEILHLIQEKNTRSVDLAKKLGAEFSHRAIIDGDDECIFVTKNPRLATVPRPGI